MQTANRHSTPTRNPSAVVATAGANPPSDGDSDKPLAVAGAVSDDAAGSSTDKEEHLGEDEHPDPPADAPLTPAAKIVSRTVHAIFLVALLGFIAWFVVVSPLRQSVTAQKNRTVVRIVGASLREVRAVAEGTFVAVAPLRSGTEVRRGQLLGRVEASRLEASLQAHDRMLEALYRRKLLLDETPAEDDDPRQRMEMERELRDCALRIVQAENDRRRDGLLREALDLSCPCDGWIQFGMSESKSVTANDTVAFIWPKNGELLVEVEGPLDVIHALIQANRVEATFRTAGGEVLVAASPLVETLRTSHREDTSSDSNQLWGFIQCSPISLPHAVRFPGPIGRLR